MKAPPGSNNKVNDGTSSLRPTDPGQDWKRGQRRDKSNYSTLKSERDWDTFQRKLIIQVHADGIENLLDPKWQAPSAEARLLDDMHNKYFFAVLESVLLTDRG